MTWKETARALRGVDVGYYATASYPVLSLADGVKLARKTLDEIPILVEVVGGMTVVLQAGQPLRRREVRA